MSRFIQDRNETDPMRCADCWHCWPRFTTTARCENHRAAGLKGCWVDLAFVQQPQQCPGFKPLVDRSPEPETEPK